MTSETLKRWRVGFVLPQVLGTATHSVLTLVVFGDDELEAENNALTIIFEEYGREMVSVLETRCSSVEVEEVLP